MAEVHKHLLIDGLFRNPPRDPSVLNDWLSRLVSVIDMQIFWEPHSSYCADPGNEGLSGIVGLTTSHISAHFWDTEQPIGKLDLYSCKNFDMKLVIKMVEEFNPEKLTFSLIDRSDRGHVVEDCGTYKYGEYT